MKKNLKISLLIVSCFSLSACFNNLTTPKSLAIKTKAAYKFTIADMAKLSSTFADKLSIQSVIDNLGTKAEQNKYSVFSYNPDNKSNYQQLLLRMPISDIPVDVGKYFDSSNINSQFNVANTKVQQTFDVPELKKQIKQNFPLDDVNKNINNNIIFTGSSLPSANLNVIFNETGNGFTSITYLEGSMLVQRAPKTDSSEPDLTGGVALLDASNNEIAAGTFENNQVLLNIDNATVTSAGMKLRFSESTGVPFIATITEESKIGYAEGITVSDVPSVNKDLTINISDSTSEFTEYKIGQGSLKSEIKIPLEWSNVGISYTANLSEAFILDGITNGETKSLNGITIDPSKNIKAALTLQFTLNNSDIDFTIDPEVQVDLVIDTLESATMKVSSELEQKLALKVKQNLPEEAIRTLDKIKWGKSSIDLYCISTLPAGNDITLAGKSDFFEINDTKTIVSGNFEQQKLSFETTEGKITDIGTTASEFDAVDFDINVGLPSYDSTAKTFTIKNLAANSSYTLDIECKTVFDWEEVILDVSSFATGVNSKVSTGINPASLFGKKEGSGTGGFDLSEVIKNLEFMNVPVYLFCTVPDAANSETSIFKNIGFNGTIKAFLGTKETDPDDKVVYTPVTGIDPVYFLGDTSGPANLVQASEPKLEASVNNEKEIITNIGKTTASATDIKDLLNTAKNSNLDAELCVDYDVKITGTDGSSSVTIKKEDLADDSPASISVSALLILPLQFKVTSTGLNIDVIGLLNKDKDPSEPDETYGDVLKRTEPWTSEEGEDKGFLNTLVGVIDDISLSYSTPTKLPLNSVEGLKLVIDLDGKERDVTLYEGTPDEKVVHVGKLYSEVEKNLSTGNSISAGEPKALLEIYPLAPTLSIKASAGDVISVPREIGFASRVGLEIVTNGEEIPVFKKTAD